MGLDDMLLRSLLFTGMNGLDWVSLLALLAIGAFYFFAPAAGYTPNRRGTLLGAMWVLIAKLGLTVLKIGIMVLAYMDGAVGSGGGGFSSSGGNQMSFAGGLNMVIVLVESALFLLAMVLFVAGISSLRRTDDLRPFRRDSLGDD